MYILVSDYVEVTGVAKMIITSSEWVFFRSLYQYRFTKKYSLKALPDQLSVSFIEKILVDLSVRVSLPPFHDQCIREFASVLLSTLQQE